MEECKYGKGVRAEGVSGYFEDTYNSTKSCKKENQEEEHQELPSFTSPVK